TELRRAVKDDPALDPAPIVMARFIGEAGDAGKAPQGGEYALRSGPPEPKGLLGAGLHYPEHNPVEPARAHTEAPPRFGSAWAAIREARGLVAWHRKGFAAAEERFQEVVVEAPGNIGASCVLALALVEQPSEGKHRRALELAESLARQEPNSGAVLTTLGW